MNLKRNMGSIFKSPKPPAAPDPAATARAQAEANRLTQITPTGNLYFGTYDPNTGQFTRGKQDALMVEETPFQKQLRERAEGLTLGLGEQLSTDLQAVRTAEDIESLDLPALQQDFGAEAQRLEEATYDAAVQRLRPQFEDQRRQLEQTLADQGLPRGSRAFDEEIRKLDERQNEQLSRLALDTVSQGRAEQDRLARLSAALRGQGLNEQLALAQLESGARGQRFSELGSLLGFNTPFVQQQYQPIDVAGITQAGYQNQLGQYGLQQQRRAQQMQDISQLAQMGAFFSSDKRLKEDIKYIKDVEGVPVYEFNYKVNPDKRFRGTIAQDILKTHPEAVITEKDGYYSVNYDLLPIDMVKVKNG